MENIRCPRQRFQWKKDHPTFQNHVKSVLNIATKQKEDHEQPNFPEIFTKIEEGEHYLDKDNHQNAWRPKLKKKNSTYQMTIAQKWYE
jgi:hypothetical protein